MKMYIDINYAELSLIRVPLLSMACS